MDVQERHGLGIDDICPQERNEIELSRHCPHMPDTLVFLNEERINDDEIRLTFQCSCGKIVHEDYSLNRLVD